MRPFSYERPDDLASAVQAGSQQGAYFIAGGTNLLDLMKVDVERPRHLVDVSRLPLREMEETPGGGLRIGALVSNADLAANEHVRRRYPMLALALLNIAWQHASADWQAVLSGNPPSRALQARAVLSILLWLAVVVAGRWIGFL